MKLYRVLKEMITTIQDILTWKPTYKWQAATGSDSHGRTIFTCGPIKIVLGYYAITPSANTTSTTTTVYFRSTFNTAPYVFLTSRGNPQVSVFNYSISAAPTTTSFTAQLYASNTTSRGFYFVAIGTNPGWDYS